MAMSEPDPYQPPQAPLSDPPTESSEVWRVPYVITMWCSGVVGIMSFPIYPFDMSGWPEAPSLGLHFAWLIPFWCGVASITAGFLLFGLPRIVDKLGAAAGIGTVGMLPTLMAVKWWLHYM